MPQVNILVIRYRRIYFLTDMEMMGESIQLPNSYEITEK